MRFFYFLARSISYSFALSFFAVIVGWFATTVGFFLSSSFIIFSYEKIIDMIFRWLPISMLIATLVHFVHYGFLTPVRVPSLIKSFRIINRAFVRKFYMEEDEMVDVYHRLSDVPLLTAFHSALYSMGIGVFIFLFILYEYILAGHIGYEQTMEIFKILAISIVIIIMFNGMITYLLIEYLTNNDRALLYNRLVQKGHKEEPHSLISMRVKFMFFIILLVITLLSFAALMEKGRFYAEYNIEIIIAYLVMSLLVAVVLMQVNTNSILRVFQDLRRVTREISSGGQSGFRILSLEKEIASIEFALMEMSWEIDEHRKNMELMVEQRTHELQDAMTDLKEKDDQMQKQLDMASVIQRSILPGEIQDWNELKFCVRYVAMEKIGGDFYDVYHLKDDKLGVMIADVSGHGIPAALVTTMAKISFNNAGGRFDSPRRIFQEVNQNILDHVKTQDYMTSFMVVFDDEYNVTYSNASHQKALLLRTEKGEVEELDTNGLFIGAIEEANDSYDELRSQLNYGDRVVLYTDGIPEALNSERKEYGIERLESIALQNRGMGLDEFADSIIDDVNTHIGSTQVEDDLTLLVIELARDEAVDLIKNAKKLVSTHKYNEALEILQHGLEKFPGNQKILYNLAKNYFRVNNYARTIELISQYLENDERNKYAFYIAGAANYQMYDYQRAIEMFEKAVDLDTNFVNAMFALGMAHKKSDNQEEAIKSFERVVNLDPDNKMALFELSELNQE